MLAQEQAGELTTGDACSMVAISEGADGVAAPRAFSTSGV